MSVAELIFLLYQLTPEIKLKVIHSAVFIFLFSNHAKLILSRIMKSVLSVGLIFLWVLIIYVKLLIIPLYHYIGKIDKDLLSCNLILQAAKISCRITFDRQKTRSSWIILSRQNTIEFQLTNTIEAKSHRIRDEKKYKLLFAQRNKERSMSVN